MVHDPKYFYVSKVLGTLPTSGDLQFSVWYKDGTWKMHETLSHSHSGKYTENVSLDFSWDGQIFGSFTLPVIFWNLCVHSHITRKDPVKTHDISCAMHVLFH